MAKTVFQDSINLFLPTGAYRQIAFFYGTDPTPGVNSKIKTAPIFEDRMCFHITGGFVAQAVITGFHRWRSITRVDC